MYVESIVDEAAAEQGFSKYLWFSPSELLHEYYLMIHKLQ